MIDIVPLSEKYLDSLIERFDNDVERFVRYMQEAVREERSVLLAIQDNAVVGYVTLIWKSAYPAFIKNNTPEIVDFIVLPAVRGKGYGAQLLEHSEKLAKERRYKSIGLGVGLGKDYGVAQRLYGRTGYYADGTGIWCDGKQVSDGDNITLSPHSVLMMVKPL